MELAKNGFPGELLSGDQIESFDINGDEFKIELYESVDIDVDHELVKGIRVNKVVKGTIKENVLTLDKGGIEVRGIPIVGSGSIRVIQKTPEGLFNITAKKGILSYTLKDYDLYGALGSR